MKILTIADVVVPVLSGDLDPERFADIDLVLGCGDLPPEYLASITNALEVPLYYVRGNHDLRFANSPPEGCLDLHGRLARFNDLKILGLEGSRWYNGGPQTVPQTGAVF